VFARQSEAGFGSGGALDPIALTFEFIAQNLAEVFFVFHQEDLCMRHDRPPDESAESSKYIVPNILGIADLNQEKKLCNNLVYFTVSVFFNETAAVRERLKVLR
jgi:hypothetical protein